jgi:hypothetical protein
VDPSIAHETCTPPFRDLPPTSVNASALDTDWNAKQIAALADAITRYWNWKRNLLRLREERKRS